MLDLLDWGWGCGPHTAWLLAAEGGEIERAQHVARQPARMPALREGLFVYL